MCVCVAAMATVVTVCGDCIQRRDFAASTAVLAMANHHLLLQQHLTHITLAVWHRQPQYSKLETAPLHNF